MRLWVLLILVGVCHYAVANEAEIYLKKSTDNLWYNTLLSKGFFKAAKEVYDPPKSYALLVGVSDYEDNENWLSLPETQYDVDRLRRYLTEEEGFDEVIVLKNQAASKSQIDHLMVDYYPSKLNENDRFLFYFSGHGTERKIGTSENDYKGYLVLTESKDYSSMISMSQVNTWHSLGRKAIQSLYIIDSCFSGLAGYKSKSNRFIEKLYSYGHHIITAGTKNEEALASTEKWGGSLFTFALLKGLQGRADSGSEDFKKDGIISLKELMIYIEKRVFNELEAKSKRRKMTPQMSELSLDNEGEFFFVSKSETNSESIVYSRDGLDSVGLIRSKGRGGKFDRELREELMAFLHYDIVYFNHDQSFIKDEYRKKLKLHAKFIQKYDLTVRLEGHTSERGTREYNWALGERLANSVRDFLEIHGVDRARLETVSYGEERPADISSTEAAWAKNRRVEIVYQ